MKRTLSDEELKFYGEQIAIILQLRPDVRHSRRFRTTWGNKSTLGIAKVVMRMSEEMLAGNPLGDAAIDEP